MHIARPSGSGTSEPPARVPTGSVGRGEGIPLQRTSRDQIAEAPRTGWHGTQLFQRTVDLFDVSIIERGHFIACVFANSRRRKRYAKRNHGFQVRNPSTARVRGQMSITRPKRSKQKAL
jgi:hypothetical protein